MSNQKVTFEIDRCEEPNCKRRREFPSMGRQCFVHQTLDRARWLSREDLNALRALLGAVQVHSDEERRLRRSDLAASRLELDAGSMARSRARAIEAGLTADEAQRIVDRATGASA